MDNMKKKNDITALLKCFFCEYNDIPKFLRFYRRVFRLLHGKGLPITTETGREKNHILRSLYSLSFSLSHCPKHTLNVRKYFVSKYPETKKALQYFIEATVGRIRQFSGIQR